MKIIVYLFLTFLLLISCNHEKGLVTETLSFDIGFDPLIHYSGSFFNRETEKDCIYFSDTKTNKCIKLFELNNPHFIDSIPLKKVIDILEEIDGISILSKDTIILSSLHTNKIAIINAKGNCYKYIDLNTIINNGKEDYYEISSTFLNQQTDQNSILYHCEWRYNKKDQADSIEPGTKLAYLKYWHNKEFHAPFLVNIFGYLKDSIHTQFGLNDFYKNIMPEGCMSGELPFYTYANNSLFIFSYYSDKLFVVDKKTLTIQRKIPITSQYTTLGIQPLHIDSSTVDSFQDYTDDFCSMAPYVMAFLYNEKPQQYYLLLNHRIGKGVEDSLGGYQNRPFSVILFDKELKQQKEIAFLDQRYSGGFSIMTQKGLMIRKNKNDEGDKTITFDVFNFKN